jgi:hypothetical protein
MLSRNCKQNTIVTQRGEAELQKLLGNANKALERESGYCQRRLQMADVSKKEIIQKMEELKDGARFCLCPTYGGSGDH